MDPAAEGGLAGAFTWVDWAVVLGLLALTTWVGERKAGRQGTMRDFFLGGRRLPWFAVAASIVATEISAVTYVALPARVWQPGGNLTYLQIGLVGSLFAKCFIGFVLVPAYFQREIYSPYDYMGARLGARARAVATGLFSVGGVLGQSARVYMTAVVLEVILADELARVGAFVGLSPLATAVSAIGLVAVVWTLIGGIATVVWTDAILFVLFLIGCAIALGTAAAGVEGGLGAVVEAGREAGKTRLLDLDTDPTKPFTLWTALIASTWGMIGFYGTDQLIAQRLFCCRDARAARKAIVASYGAMVVTALVAFVGLALFAYYQQNPLEGAGAELVAQKADRVFPVFIVEVIPAGLKGLVVAGAFAAAISSLDSILAALSQTTLSALYLPWWRRRGKGAPDERRTLRVSRALVVVYAVLLCAMAVAMDVVVRDFASILDLALAMASYTGGALIAGFFLAFLPLGVDGSGYAWSAPLSVLTVFAVSSHQQWAQGLWVHPETLCLVAAALGALAWIVFRAVPDARGGVPRGRVVGQALAWFLGLAFVVWISREGWFAGELGADGGVAREVLAWPWWVPLGSTVAFVLGWGLARRGAGSNGPALRSAPAGEGHG